MPDNGVASSSSVASTFDVGFREINGRAPTAEETKRFLTFERLARTSEPPLDPLTMLLMVDPTRAFGSEKERAALFEQLDRIESMQSPAAASAPAPAPVAPSKDLDARLTRIEQAILQNRPQIMLGPRGWWQAVVVFMIACAAVALVVWYAMNEYSRPGLNVLVLAAWFVGGVGLTTVYYELRNR
jgi:hypothetical protein